MKKFCIILLLTLPMLAFGQLPGAYLEDWVAHNYAQPVTCQGDRNIPAVVDVVKSTAKNSGTLGAQVMVMDGNRNVLSCGIGYNDPLAAQKLSAGSEPIRLGFNTPQRAASITKRYALIALRQLQLAGKVNLSDNLLAASGVTSFDGVVRQAGFSSCTIQMALDYLCYLNVNYATAEEVEQKTGWKRPLSFDQQLRYEVGRSLFLTPEVGGYSNVAYGLLDKVIERASGMSTKDYISQAVIIPSATQQEEIQIVLGAHQMCSDGKWITVKGIQRCQNAGNAVAGREPGEMSYSSTYTYPSEYDGVIVQADLSGRLENSGLAFNFVATPRAVLHSIAYFDKSGNVRDPNSTTGFNLIGGVVTSSMVQAYREGKLSVFVGFNRSTREPGTNRTVAEVAIEAAFNSARAVDWSVYSDLDTDSLSRIQMRTYCNTALNYCFLAGPLSAAVLDNAPGWVRQSGEGDGFTAWAPGVKKNVYRFFHEGEVTHFFGTYDDAKLVTRFNPQLPLTQVDGFIGFRYEAIEMSVVQPNISAGTCESGTVPVYRLFRAKSGTLSANHRYTTSLAFYKEEVARGLAGEGVVFCGAQ